MLTSRMFALEFTARVGTIGWFPAPPRTHSLLALYIASRGIVTGMWTESLTDRTRIGLALVRGASCVASILWIAYVARRVVANFTHRCLADWFTDGRANRRVTRPRALGMTFLRLPDIQEQEKQNKHACEKHHFKPLVFFIKCVAMFQNKRRLMYLYVAEIDMARHRADTKSSSYSRKSSRRFSIHPRPTLTDMPDRQTRRLPYRG
jgi:hypothetical protein